MFKANTSFRAREWSVLPISRMNGGLNEVDDTRFVKTMYCTEAHNMVFDEISLKRRPAFSPSVAIDGWAASVRAIGRQDGYWYRVISAGKVQFFNSGAWSDVVTLTTSSALHTFVPVKSCGTSAIVSGTANGGSSRTLTTTGLTVSAYIGNVLKITGGTGSGQSFLIAANTATEIIIDGIFDVLPDATSTFSIFYQIPMIELVNENNPMHGFYSSGSYVAHSTVPTGSPVSWDWWNDRLWVSSNDGRVYFSAFGNSSFIPKNNYIEVPGAKKSYVQAVNEKLVVFASSGTFEIIGSSPDDFRIVKIRDVGMREPNTFNRTFCLWTNEVYFLSTRWVEAVGALEQQTPYPALPISRNLKELPHISISQGSQVFFAAERLWVYDSVQGKGWIYDVKRSIETGVPVWSTFATTIGEIVSWWKEAAQTFVTIGGVIYEVKEDSDAEAFVCSYATTRLTAGDAERPKNVYKGRFVTKTVEDGIMKIQASFDGKPYVDVKTLAFTGTSAEEERQYDFVLSKSAYDVKIRIERQLSWTTKGFKVSYAEIWLDSEAKTV